MNRIQRWITGALLIVSLGRPLHGQITDSPAVATAMSVDAFQVPSGGSVSRSIVVDATSTLSVSIVAASQTLSIVLRSPSGVRYTVGEASLNFSSAVVRIEGSTKPGASYLATIISPTSGTWTITVADTVSLVAPLDVVMTALFNNTTRLAVLGGGEEYPANVSVRIALAAFDRSSRLGSLTVTARLYRPSDPAVLPVAVSFRDDGTGGDEIAGDRIYGTIVNPGQPGTYALKVDVNGTASTGVFRRSGAAELKIVSRDVQINGFSDQGFDDDFDGLYDRVAIIPSANVLRAGVYRVAVVLRASNGKVIQRSAESSLTPGAEFVEVPFGAADISRDLGVDGPYDVSEVRFQRFSGDDLVTADLRYDLGATGRYTLSGIQHARLRLTGTGEAFGIDTNANNRFDYLEIDIGVIADFAGTYTASVSLTDRNGREIGFANGDVLLAEGNNPISITFDGNPIGANRVDGPYVLANLIFYGEDQSLIVNHAFTTQAFHASDFEGYPFATKRRAIRHDSQRSSIMHAN